MPLTTKDWKDDPDASTPLSAAALEDMEARLGAYADTVAAALASRIQVARAFNAGAFTAAQTRDVTITWPAPFVDTNYTATFVLHDVSGSANNSAGRQIQGAKTVNGITIRIASGSVGYSSGQLLIDAIAIHD